MAIAPEVKEFLEEHKVPYEVIRHPPAYTAQEEAAVTHISGYEWAKTVVLMTERGEPIMAVLPASYRVEIPKLKGLVGERPDASLRLASEDQFRGLYGNCEPGGMPPLGVIYGQKVYVDERLAEDETIVFNAGNHEEAIRMRYADFARLVHPVVGHFGRPTR